MTCHMRNALRLFAALALCLSLGGAASAQETSGTLFGTVTDSAGAAVKGATVTITDDDKKLVARTVQTDDDGQYSAPSLPAGNYTVRVEVTNFKKSVQTSIKLDVTSGGRPTSR